MKKAMLWMLTGALCWSLTACGGQDAGDSTASTQGSNTSTTSAQGAEASAQSSGTSAADTPQIPTYSVGETVSTDIFSFTLQAAQWTIALDNVSGETFFLPKEYSAQDDADNPYVAPIGHTYIAMTIVGTNLDRATNELYSSFGSPLLTEVQVDGQTYPVTMECGAVMTNLDKTVLDPNGYPNTIHANQWYSDVTSNMLLQVGESQTRRVYLDVAEEITDLTTPFSFTVQIPNSDGEKEEFTYQVTGA